MACTNKSCLIALAEKDFAKLRKLIGTIDPETAALGTDGVTIKDVIGHRAHWLDLFFGWHTDGAMGKKVFFPAKGYKWNDLKRYNADLRARQADLDWSAVCDLLEDRHAQLIAFLTDHSDTDLYSAPMKGANNA